jgi:NADH:ubiquinone oxidoreductase subunit E
MSLPIAGGRKGPSRSPTHRSLEHQKMLNLGLAVEEAADGEPITAEAIDELALEQGVDASHLYAAAAVTTDVEFAREHEIAFVACGGVCQNWGALECIEHLVELRQERLDGGKPGFDIQAKSCLDKCEHAPAVMVVTPDGSALIARAGKDSLRQAVEQACD